MWLRDRWPIRRESRLMGCSPAAGADRTVSPDAHASCARESLWKCLEAGMPVGTNRSILSKTNRTINLTDYASLRILLSQVPQEIWRSADHQGARHQADPLSKVQRHGRGYSNRPIFRTQ